MRDAPLVTLEDIRRAAANLAGVAIRTPLVPFGTVAGGTARVLLKAESLQPIGAFKIRGAYHAIASLSAGELARGVVTHSSGNHAQGVALRGAAAGNAGGHRHAVERAGDQAPRASRRTAPRSSRSGRPATSGRRWRSGWRRSRASS